jgi:hypothetical protein
MPGDMTLSFVKPRQNAQDKIFSHFQMRTSCFIRLNHYTIPALNTKILRQTKKRFAFILVALMLKFTPTVVLCVNP